MSSRPPSGASVVPSVAKARSPPESRKAKRERLHRERAEREAGARAAVERDQHDVRENIEVKAHLEWTQMQLKFREHQVRRSVDKYFYNELLQKVDAVTEKFREDKRTIAEDRKRLRLAKEKLEVELCEIRLDQKLQAKMLPQKIHDLEDRMRQALQAVIESLEKEKEKDTRTVMQNFNYQFGHNKQRYLDMLHEIQQKITYFSKVMMESKSIHSNLPTRLRKELNNFSKEDLLLMIDTLSFEESVLQYLEIKFPKPCTQRWPSDATPTSQLINIEQEAARAARKQKLASSGEFVNSNNNGIGQQPEEGLSGSESEDETERLVTTKNVPGLHLPETSESQLITSSYSNPSSNPSSSKRTQSVRTPPLSRSSTGNSFVSRGSSKDKGGGGFTGFSFGGTATDEASDFQSETSL